MLDFLRNVGKSEHEWVEESLSAYIDAELSAKEMARMERHLEECEGCTESLATLRQTIALVRELPSVPAPRSFAIRPAPVRPKARPVAPGWGYGMLKGAAALAVLLLVVLVGGDLALRSFGGFRLAAPASMPPAAEVALAPSAVPSVDFFGDVELETTVGEGRATDAPAEGTPLLEGEEPPAPAAAATEASGAFRAPSTEGTVQPATESIDDVDSAGTPTAAGTPVEQETGVMGAGPAATSMPATTGTPTASPVLKADETGPTGTATSPAGAEEQRMENADLAATPTPTATPEAVALAERPAEEAQARDEVRSLGPTSLLPSLRLAELVVSVILLVLIPVTLLTGWLIRRRGP